MLRDAPFPRRKVSRPVTVGSGNGPTYTRIPRPSPPEFARKRINLSTAQAACCAIRGWSRRLRSSWSSRTRGGGGKHTQPATDVVRDQAVGLPRAASSVPTMIAAATLSLRGEKSDSSGTLTDPTTMFRSACDCASAHQLQRSRQLREQLFAELRIDVEERGARDLV